jgi:hypothetical protein
MPPADVGAARLTRRGYGPLALSEYTEEQLDAALDALSNPERFRRAEAMIATAAPRLQRVLAQALEEGGWFGESHEAEVRKTAGVPDEGERVSALRTLLAEEARMGMMVGVAVGWALAEELGRGAAGGRADDEED